MRSRSHLLILMCLLALLCGAGVWGWMSSGKQATPDVRIDRFDRVLDEYVSLGSYSALHRMNMQYPAETKLLIEDVLKLGHVHDPDVELRLRRYYLDSTVQALLDEVHRQYADLSDLEDSFAKAFRALRKERPGLRMPHIYSQVSCLNQSIVVGDTLIGISLDKYLGADFPIYEEYYTEEQRAQMTREAIVTDAINAYLQYHRTP